MKPFKLRALCFIVLSASYCSYAQTTVKRTESCVKKSAKIAKAKVPSRVTEIYLKEYPVTTYNPKK
jgi:hypothetical protein